MARLNIVLYAAGALAGAGSLVGSAGAADLPTPLPPMAPVEAVALPVTELGSGWYLRGDVGAVEYAHPKEDRAYSREQGYTNALVGLRLQNTWSGGGGVGYQFNNWLRADVTADYRSDVKFRDFSSASQFSQGYNLETGKFGASTVLANAYVDLGNWGGFTPYVGAGVGASYKTFHRFYSQTTCLTTACGGGTDGVYVVGAQTPIYRANKGAFDLAWALTGGVAYTLPGGFTVDANYRYVNLGMAETGFDAERVNTRLKPIEAHEVRVGFRYMID